MMRLQEFLMLQPMVAKYADRYTKPLIKYEGGKVPERYIIKWVEHEDTSVNDVAMFYVGVCNRYYTEVPHILASLERLHGFNIPINEGILTADYWIQWGIENQIALLDEHDNFINARG